MDRNTRQPSGKRCASGILVKVLIGPDVSILHHIFRFGIIVQNRASDTIQALVVPAHDNFVQSRIAGFDPLDDLLVGPAFGFGLFQSYDGSHGSLKYRAYRSRMVT